MQKNVVKCFFGEIKFLFFSKLPQRQLVLATEKIHKFLHQFAHLFMFLHSFLLFAVKSKVITSAHNLKSTQTASIFVFFFSSFIWTLVIVLVKKWKKNCNVQMKTIPTKWKLETMQNEINRRRKPSESKTMRIKATIKYFSCFCCCCD